MWIFSRPMDRVFYVYSFKMKHTFQLVTGEMVMSALANFMKRLNLVVEANGGHIEE